MVLISETLSKSPATVLCNGIVFTSYIKIGIVQNIEMLLKMENVLNGVLLFFV